MKKTTLTAMVMAAMVLVSGCSTTPTTTIEVTTGNISIDETPITESYEETKDDEVIHVVPGDFDLQVDEPSNHGTVKAVICMNEFREKYEAEIQGYSIGTYDVDFILNDSKSINFVDFVDYEILFETDTWSSIRVELHDSPYGNPCFETLSYIVEV